MTTGRHEHPGAPGLDHKRLAGHMADDHGWLVGRAHAASYGELLFHHSWYHRDDNERHDVSTPVTDPSAWYEAEQRADRELAMAKRAEYGSADLRIMASALREMLPDPELSELRDAFGNGEYGGMEQQDDEGYYIEAAIVFYVLGKVSRIVGALSEGRVPSLDSWHDITVYSMMARRTRNSGGW